MVHTDGDAGYMATMGSCTVFWGHKGSADVDKRLTDEGKQRHGNGWKESKQLNEICCDAYNSMASFKESSSMAIKTKLKGQILVAKHFNT